MRKTLCLLLSLIITVSCFTVLSASAAEGAGSENQVYLLGDVDMDGEITVVDATIIQRAEIGLYELSGLQKVLADITGSGVDITCATLIQRNLASIPTKYPIGENIADENEGVVYQDDVMIHQSNGGDYVYSVMDHAIFSTAYPDVAFITDKEAMLSFALILGYQQSDVTVETADNVHYYTFPNGATVIFDYDEKEIVFSDYSTFVTANGSTPLSPYGNGLPASLNINGCTLFETQDTTKYYGSDPCCITFDYDSIPMLQTGEDIVIPLQTYSDFFTSQKKTFFQYNGESIYVITSSTKANEPNYWAQYNNDTVKRETISPALAQVNYYELCAVLEARYGLKKAHDIDDFDSYFRRRGLRSEFLSCDVKRIETAVNKMGFLLFEDFHSGSNSDSPFLKEELNIPANELNSPIFQNRRENFTAMVMKRNQVLGTNVAPYERRGDTVFITFDEFSISNLAYYYTEGYEPSPDGDTIDLFVYALKRLQNEDSDAKNVVIDIACNGGGTCVACGFAMDAIIGKAIICVQNPNTSALTQNVMKFDLNLDGTIDENDISMKKMGKNIAVVMSDSSFSCGNLLPCSLNALDDNVLLMGQQSGGGSCVVAYISTALGSIMQISGEQMLVTMKNGYIRDIDGGVSPEVPLTMNRIFDRDYIVNVVNDQFG